MHTLFLFLKDGDVGDPGFLQFDRHEDAGHAGADNNDRWISLRASRHSVPLGSVHDVVPL